MLKAERLEMTRKLEPAGRTVGSLSSGRGCFEAKRQEMLLRLEAWRKPRNGSGLYIGPALQPKASDNVHLSHGALFVRCNSCGCRALKVAKVANYCSDKLF